MSVNTIAPHDFKHDYRLHYRQQTSKICEFSIVTCGITSLQNFIKICRQKIVTKIHRLMWTSEVMLDLVELGYVRLS